MNVKPDFSKSRNHAESAPAFLSIWDMHAYYGESYIVQGISFNVHEGEILALLGRNGAGKTSTLRAIARLASPEATGDRGEEAARSCRGHGEHLGDAASLRELCQYHGRKGRCLC